MKQTQRQWSGFWINTGKVINVPVAECGAAPCLRKTFICTEKIHKAIVYLCGIGYHILYINGQKADDRVLAPSPSQYDHHVSYIEYDVSSLLRMGKNAIAVILGNGLYNQQIEDTWGFYHAPWRDYPKLLCDVEVDGRLIAKSDTSWRWHDSQITFNALRNGQYTDGRLKLDGFATADFDDSGWGYAVRTLPPGGIVVREEQEPCKVMQSYSPVESWFVSARETTYDFGINLTGWCRVRVRGKMGSRVWIRYGEQIASISHQLNVQEISHHVKTGIFQCDQYTLQGNGEIETFEPAFTYHGFRYAQVFNWDNADIVDIEAEFVHTSFVTVGSFQCSSVMMNTLQKNTLQSFRSNYTGIPTDCPHREKNGWSADAQLAAETGCWNFNVKKAFSHFLQIFTDTQRSNGQLSGIAPSAGWGYNRLNGPAWDSLLFEYPYLIYLFYSDADPILRSYDHCRRYLDYCASMAEDGLVDFGLGDWCHWDSRRITPVKATSSCFYYQCVQRMALFARILGAEVDEKAYSELAQRSRQAILKTFYHHDAGFADNSQTALAMALEFGLLEEQERPLLSRRLVESVRVNEHKADFGILGAKFVPRALAGSGYVDDGFQLITQKQFPGWGWQVEHGATSLWENWNGQESQNHIMFGDISAWMYRYLAGIQPILEMPGFQKFMISPQFVKQLDWVKCSYRIAQGVIRCSWQKKSNHMIHCHFEIPSGTVADIHLPGRIFGGQSGVVELDIPVLDASDVTNQVRTEHEVE